MKTRLITALVAIVALFVVIYLLPPVAAVVAFCLLCAIAAYEMLGATGVLKRHPLLWVSCAFAAAVPLLTVYGGFQALMAGVFGYVCVSLGWAVFDYKRLGFSQVAEGFFGAFAIPFLLSAALRILTANEMGRQLILMPCIAAWCSDSAAYFAGMLFGKHKLAPHVSPKKTVEGAVGGLLGSLVGMLVFGFVMQHQFGASPDYILLAVGGVIDAAVGQCGDLSMSLIKRSCGIKDFGRLFPGHGGVLDRFDSVLFTAPFFEIMLAFTGII